MSQQKMLDELDARSQIHGAVTRFCRGADRLDQAMMVSAYHRDGWDDHGVFAGPPEQLAEWVVKLHSDHFIYTGHYIMNELVELDGDKAHGETYVQGVFRFEREGQLFDMLGYGRYIDRYESRDGVWRIAHRVALADWNRIDPVLERPQGDLVKKLTEGTRTSEDVSYTVFAAPKPLSLGAPATAV